MQTLNLIMASFFLVLSPFIHSTSLAQSYPAVEFTDFKLFNQSVSVGNGSPLERPLGQTHQIILQPHQSISFTIEFSVKDTTLSHQVSYSWMLEGFDQEWISVGKHTSATYTNLLPGQYLFKVKATTQDGKWGEPYASLQLVLKAPFYQTWWFRLLGLASIGLLLWVLYTRRIRQLEEKSKLQGLIQAEILGKKEAQQRLLEAELKAIRSQLNPHFLFNSLSSIQNLINQQQTEAANIYLAKFAGLLRMILDNSEQPTISLFQELAAIRTYLELESLRIDFTYQITIDNHLDEHTTEIPSMVLQPFIENAIQHGLAPLPSNRQLQIAIHQKANQLHCRIEDNGIGIQQSMALKKGLPNKEWGLKLSRERLVGIGQLQGFQPNFAIQDKAGLNTDQTGTIVTFMLPILD